MTQEIFTLAWFAVVTLGGVVGFALVVLGYLIGLKVITFVEYRHYYASTRREMRARRRHLKRKYKQNPALFYPH